jgi:hypothetical protein
MAQVTMTVGVAPSTPIAGSVTIYAKTDKLLYSKDDSGLETLVSSAGSTASKLQTASGVVSVGAATAPSVGQVLMATSSTVATWQSVSTAIIGTQSVADAATITPNANTDANVDITAIAQAFTIANPTGTPTNFQKLLIRIKDNGTARGISWGTSYVAGGVTLPLTTVLSKIMTLGFIYNTANALNKWQLVALSQEA